MRAKVEELEAQLGKELVVFVDGVRVAFPVEFDTEEGWCTALEYRLPGVHRAKRVTLDDALNEAQSSSEDLGLQELEPVEIRVSGKVQIAYWEVEEDAGTA